MQDFNTLLRLANEARTRIREIQPDEAEQLVLAGAVLLDVRDDREFTTGHIAGATHLSRESLEARIADIVPDQSTPIVCYCAVGHRSAIAADSLLKLGYRTVASIHGGIKAYLARPHALKVA